MSAAFAVSLFPYYNNVFFSAVFLPVLFQQFLPVPFFFCFVSDSGVFLPALLAVLFFLFQKIFSFFFPAFCRTSFRSSCLHHPSASKNYPVRIAFTRPLPSFLRFACVVRFLQRPSCPKFRLRGLYNLCPLPAFPVGLEPICLPRFTGPLPSFLRFACVVRFLQRPFCPKFLLSGLYNLCPTPTSPSARKPTCPRTCLDSAPFFLPIFCSISIFCRFRVVFCF